MSASSNVSNWHEAVIALIGVTRRLLGLNGTLYPFKPGTLPCSRRREGLRV